MGPFWTICLRLLNAHSQRGHVPVVVENFGGLDGLLFAGWRYGSNASTGDSTAGSSTATLEAPTADTRRLLGRDARRRRFAVMEDTWTSRDLPVLKAVVQIYEDTGRPMIPVTDIQQAVGFDKDTMRRAIQALYTERTDPFFEEPGGSWSGGVIRVGAPTGRALRVAGQWPTPENIVERLIAAFEAVAEDETRDEPERSKAKQTALWLGDTLSKIAIGALGGAGGHMLYS
jgi:hypothetical protein